MKKMLLGLSLVALAVSSATAILAQDYHKGLAAANTGDHATALKEWKPLAEQGHAKAQFNLGFMYEKGQGVPQDYTEAERWYRLSAEQGDAKAQYSLGFMYLGDRGVPQDHTEALKWIRLSAEQGLGIGQGMLGIIYRYGIGVPQSEVMAHMWYNIASANGDSEAGEYRDELADKMTSANISKAQEMARECMNSGYENCGWES